jgi:tetraacyldisaccharide 4'-kinase
VLYGAAVQVRNALFAWGVIGCERASLPVISVGNLAVGGTGKTPLVLAIGEWLFGAGFAVGVLTRGYGRRSRRPLVVPAGEAWPPASEIGDEPWFLKRREPRFALAVDANRRRGARALAPLLSGGVFLLDDGFQHRRLDRDLDLVVLAAGDPLESSRLLPRGRLREPPAALARANRCILVVGPGESPAAAEARAREVRGIAPSLPLAVATAAIDGFRPLGDWAAPLVPPAAVGGPVAAVAGIARPDRLARGLVAAGLEVAGTAFFPDHHPFTESDRGRIAALARGARSLVTTEKDEPRLLAGLGPDLARHLGLPVLVARLGLRFDAGEEDLRRAILAVARGGRGG